MIAEIIDVGSPGTAGGAQTAQVFAREVSLLGVDLHYQTDAGPDRMRLAQAMAQALRRSDVIITAGGVGLSAEDFTKEVICQGLGIPLDLHTESYQRIKAWYEAAGLPVPPGAQRAALSPRGGIVFPAEGGGAPGVAITAGDQCIVMLPGGEDLVPMFMGSVVPFLAKFAGATVVSRVARVFGIDERECLSKLFDLQNSRNPAMSLYSQRGEILVRVTARANNRTQAANMCTPLLKEIVGRLGDLVYGIDVDSLEAVVVTHLTQKGLQLAAAESCTGGLLTQKLNLVPGAANVFKFGVSARADRVKVQSLHVPEKLLKKCGPVSDRVAVHMACGAMDAGDADIGVAITGAAGPSAEIDTPSGLVYVAACNKSAVAVRELSLPPETDVAVIREAAVKSALNLVRLMLDYDPEPMPGAIPVAAALKGKITLCEDAAPAGESELEEDGAPRRQKRRTGGGRRGPDARTLVMIALTVVLIGALSFIGYAVWDRYFADEYEIVLPFFHHDDDKSSSSEDSAKEDASSEDSSGEDSGGTSPEDGDETSSGDGEVSQIGPAIGRRKAGGSEDESEAESAFAPAESEASLTETAAVLAASGASSAAPSAVSSSQPPQVTAAVSRPASSSAAPPKAAASSKTSSKASSKASAQTSSASAPKRPILKSSSSEEEADELRVVALTESEWEADGVDDDADFASGGGDGGGSGSYASGEKIKVKANGKSVTAPMQEVVERVVQAEMGASFAEEALKAQAVASYTYIRYYLSRGQTPDLAMAAKSGVTSKVSAAVASVIGEEVVYSGKPINATYFASSAGVTNNSEDVWSEALPYLRSVDSDEAPAKKTVRIPREDVADAIEEAFNMDAGDYDEGDWIAVDSYCDNGEYADEVLFCGRKAKPGAWVRANMFTRLPSHAFSVKYDGGSDEFVFTCYGSGHGVGMSQMGAQAMANGGDSYTDILEHYYTGARVK